jgi:lantibiotic biosynthesis protein
MFNPSSTDPSPHSDHHLALPWQPILSGECQTEALATISAIAHQLMAEPPQAGESPDLALFFAYLSQANPGQTDYTAVALAHLEQMLGHVVTTPLGAGLYGGLAGVGWTLAHVGQILLIKDEESTATIDEVLYEHVDHTPWPGEYDLINGLVGIGVYALERLPQATGAALLARVIDRLAELAVIVPTGVTWFTPPERLPDPQRALCPTGYYNLGVAHGVPGVIALLGRTVAAGVAVDQARRLLSGAVTWLLAQEIETEQAAGFPSWVAPDPASHPSDQNPASTRQRVARSAWCYGDPGVAAILFSAALRVDEPAWAQRALHLARRAAQRPLDQQGIQDSCLCHGVAGLGHLYNRFYQATADPLLGQQARYWIEQALVLRRPGVGIAGYAFWRGHQGWEDATGFLEGAAGIGLALLAAATPLTPAWDRRLLIDLP